LGLANSVFVSFNFRKDVDLKPDFSVNDNFSFLFGGKIDPERIAIAAKGELSIVRELLLQIFLIIPLV
jgi:hypothetical protein